MQSRDLCLLSNGIASSRFIRYAYSVPRKDRGLILTSFFNILFLKQKDKKKGRG